MKKVDVLCQLPVNILCALLSEWFYFSELVQLQIAVKYGPERTLFATVLHSRAFTFENYVDISDSSLVKWLLQHSVKVSNVMFSSTCIDEVPILKYLRHNGQFVRSIDVGFPQSNQLMATVAAHCKQLSELWFSDVGINSSFTDILWCNPNLQEIWLSDVSCGTNDIFDGIKLHKLTTFSVVDCLVSGNVAGFPWTATAQSDSLEQVDLCGSSVQLVDVLALVSNCPNLKALGLGNSPRVNDDILRITNIRPTIVHMDVSKTSISDEGVRIIVQTLTALRSLDCQDCKNLTNLTLSHVADHRGTTLEVLYADIRNPSLPATLDVLHHFSAKAVSLHTLCIQCDGIELCASGGTYAITRGCPSLKRLLLVDTNITMSSRMFIKDKRPEIVIEERGEDNDYCVLDMPL